MEDISLERWKRAFATLCAIAMEKGYFDDILEFELFPFSGDEEEVRFDPSLTSEEVYEKIYKSRWEKVDEAFLKVFGYNRDIFY